MNLRHEFVPHPHKKMKSVCVETEEELKYKPAAEIRTWTLSCSTGGLNEKCVNETGTTVLKSENLE